MCFYYKTAGENFKTSVVEYINFITKSYLKITECYIYVSLYLYPHIADTIRWAGYI